MRSHSTGTVFKINRLVLYESSILKRKFYDNINHYWNFSPKVFNASLKYSDVCWCFIFQIFAMSEFEQMGKGEVEIVTLCYLFPFKDVWQQFLSFLIVC